MPTTSQLEGTFGVYLREIDRCIQGQCYWALLHLVLVLPDICAALESDDGETTGHLYVKWCEENLPHSPPPPKDRYEMRCRLLHQGTSLHQRGAFASVSFVFPDSVLSQQHGVVQRNDGAANLTLDVPTFAHEMVHSLGEWFARLHQADHRQVATNVEKNLKSLVRFQQKVSLVPISLPDGRAVEEKPVGLVMSST